ncbi:MAG: aminotransferase class III-fold pyridoxal phosphate-dependent enzyme [Candidatus Marinimicrobia bacterium]|jgi:4-aminobutyrate aminotransferase/(S)-3-amino-2-methylpropionate transaminase|nr:aminotransferase class III-fold pyridoxal phosphate-dependent enzyme [Candidatus Neomarinimicrobiota bacterium]MDP7058914.1 aminotransferase class III-fold pyridoxal phosphate-dependent enzyme [Candidatus Neomarinimicrobiota bacterium]|tara:strand:- start:884 stop:2179 length:1296 start_codon:yes stop_codon:yes gene_type:complete
MGTVNIQTDIPGPKSKELAERRTKAVVDAHSSVAPVYTAKAEGATITDVDGNVFIDFAGGIGAMNTGHGNPVITDEIKNQVDDYLHVCFTVTPYEPYVALAEKLNAMTPGDFPKKTLLVNSGAEALENSVKVARYWTERSGVIVFEHAFHGRSLMTMALTYKDMPYRHGFGPFPDVIHRLPYPYNRGKKAMEEFDSLLLEKGEESFAAVVIELVAGEGGFMPADKDFVAHIRKQCSDHGIVLVVDEVQTGFGRTGKMFSCDWYDLEPDIIAMAKSLTGGLPLSAITGQADMMDKVHVGGLGGTFGGNPASCRAGLAAIGQLEQLQASGRLDQLSTAIPQRLHALSEKSPFVNEARGIGAMYSLELCDGASEAKPSKERASEVLQNCLQDGLIMILSGTYGNVIRTLMPLVISDAELDEGMAILEKNVLSLS